MLDALGTTLYTYDGVGQLFTEAGPWTGVSVTNTYSNQLRLTSTANAPSSSAWTQNYYYDAARRLTNVTSGAGPFLYWYRSGLPSLEPVKISLGNTAYITNTYDNVARLLSTTLNSSQGSPLNLHQYRYNLAGQRTGQTNTAADYRTYAYDNSGQLVSAKGYESNGAVRLQEQLTYGYDAAGNLGVRTNNSLRETFTVNNANELLTAAPSGTLTVAGGTVPSATNVTVSGSATGTATLYHDSSWALANATLPNGAATYTATAQDAQGRQGTATLTVNLPASVNYAYDANGNLTNDANRSFAYDDENQLVSVWVPNLWRTDFAYDGKMRRRKRVECTWNGSIWVTNSITLYVYDGNLVVQEQDQNNTPKVSYTRGRDLGGSLDAAGLPRQSGASAGGIGGLLARTDNSAAAHAYYHADANGNITCLINSTQAVVATYLYDPYGKLLNQTGPLADANLYRFSSKEFHANSGLYNYLYRFYDPSLQRWLNRDPLADAGFTVIQLGLAVPSADAFGWLGKGPDLNAYGFVGNAPLNSLDPAGLKSVRQWCCEWWQKHNPWGQGDPFNKFCDLCYVTPEQIRAIYTYQATCQFLNDKYGDDWPDSARQAMDSWRRQLLHDFPSCARNIASCVPGTSLKGPVTKPK